MEYLIMILALVIVCGLQAYQIFKLEKDNQSARSEVIELNVKMAKKINDRVDGLHKLIQNTNYRQDTMQANVITALKQKADKESMDINRAVLKKHTEQLKILDAYSLEVAMTNMSSVVEYNIELQQRLRKLEAK
tara:strand:- start:56672 stop:57073 length:402 start_codon:yes stop_codon:yes gene_type:complete